MIIFISGSDLDKVKKKSDEVVQKMLQKKPGASVYKIDNENWDEFSFGHLAEARDLFVSKHIIIIDNLFSDSKSGEFLIEKLDIMKNSENAFIILEKKPNKKLSTGLKDFSEKIFEIDSEKGNAIERFNVFSLTEALGKKDKKTAWTLYLRAVNSGLSPEEVYGAVWWQFKTIYLSANSKSIDDTGLKPFVFNKAMSFSRNFSNDELKNILKNLITLYHKARNGGLSLELGLERFILSI